MSHTTIAPGGRDADLALELLADGRPGDVAECLAPVVVGEGECGQRGAIEPAVGVEDPRAEPLDERLERRLAGLHHDAGDLVGVDDHRALGPQQIGNRRLSRADPPGESHEQHCDRCYSRQIPTLGAQENHGRCRTPTRKEKSRSRNGANTEKGIP